MMEQLNMQTEMNPQVNPQSPALDHPRQAEELCTRVLQVTAELISVLDRETQLLRKGDTQAFNTLIARKTALSTAMMKDMTTLNANASYISRVVPEQIEILKDQHAQFQRSLRINHDALGAVKAITENLMRTIAEAAGQTGKGPDTYGQTAAMAGIAGAAPSAVSINRAL